MSKSSPAGQATYSEILTQTEAWQEALAIVLRHRRELRSLWERTSFSNVIFTGCGSTYYLSLAAATLFQEMTGQIARGIPASELIFSSQGVYPMQGETLLVAVSRSGETTETLMAVEEFRAAKRGEVLTISNYGNRPLATLGACNLIIPSGQEESIAQTRAFASMYVCAVALAFLLAGRDDLLDAMKGLPTAGNGLIERYDPLARDIGGDLSTDRFYFLGSGARYGLACEANLKMKEMSLTHSEPFHFYEFRHGPKSMVGRTTVISALYSRQNRSHEAAVIAEMRALGARALTLGEGDADIDFRSEIPEVAANVLFLPILQLTAYYRSLAKGLNPDHPNNLDAVVKLGDIPGFMPAGAG